MKEIIVALDHKNYKQNFELILKLGNHQKWYKVGPVLFLNNPEIIPFLKEKGKAVMLDLKFHDIPNTVKGSCYQAAKMGVDMLTIHLSGGEKMIKNAIEGINEHTVEADQLVFNKQFNSSLILGVSILTSHKSRKSYSSWICTTLAVRAC